MAQGDRVILDGEKLDHLIQALAVRGYEVVGPTIKDGSLVYDKLASSADLPRGIGDEQSGGRYRLTRRDDSALFGYVVGAHSWKRFLHPSQLTLWRARRSEDGFEFVEGRDKGPRYAFLGVRACELAAIAVQDKVFLGGSHVDPSYEARRHEAFLVAVNCGQAGGNCFCVSTETGPRAKSGYDLSLSEILIGGHRFLIEVGSERGAEVAAELPTRAASEADLHAADALSEKASGQMGRDFEIEGLKELLYRHYESPRWDAVAERCLTCANCTMVCPTCFCVSALDVGDLTGTVAERRQRWDSCFTSDFSYIHGGSVRTSARARYRQWITHKLAAWQDQFGTLGCVGCGRCITWCPVGIDITEEVKALRKGEATPAEGR